MPWLQLIFEAWEDYKAARAREAAEREAEAAAAQHVADPDDALDETGADDRNNENHKKKRRKHKK